MKKMAFLLVCVLAVSLFVGCVDNPVSAPTPTPTPRYEDAEFLSWLLHTSDIITRDLNALSESANSINIFKTRDRAKRLYNDCEIALDEIDNFDISPELVPVREEVRSGLYDLKMAALHIQHFRYDEAIEYLERGGNHFSRATEMIRDMGEYIL